MPIFLDIFHIMQSRSKSYPMIDENRITEDIINQIELTDSSYLIHHALNNIVKETCVQTTYSPLTKIRKGQYVLSRSMILELLFRFSTFLFTNQQVMKDKLKKINSDKDKAF